MGMLTIFCGETNIKIPREEEGRYIYINGTSEERENLIQGHKTILRMEILKISLFILPQKCERCV